MKRFTALLVCLAITGMAFGQAQVGDTAPDFDATDTKGNDVNLYNTLDAGAVVVLDFMASWCGPCAASTPSLSAIYDDFGSGADGAFVHVWALDIEPNDNDAAIDALDQSWGKTYPGFADQRDEYTFYFGSPTGYSIPHFAIVGADRLVKYSDSGFGGSTEATLRSIINDNIQPVAEFSNDIDPNDGVTVAFNSGDSKFGETYLWEFGDGATSQDANPTHTYLTNGTYDVKLTVSNSHVMTTSDVTYQVAITNVGINEINPNPLALAVFPSPTADNFNVKFNIDQPSEVTVKIFNIQGSEVYTDALGTFSGQYVKSFNDLAKGVYTVQVSSANGVSTKKLVVQ